jgi:hypothetical protein
MPLQIDSAETRRSATLAECDVCQKLLAEMNSTFYAVHEFIIANRDTRAVTESYLGDLGVLIQAQVAAHRKLVHHQNTH